MERSEFKKLLIGSLDGDSDPAETVAKIQEAGADFSFSPGFRDKILSRIGSEGVIINRQIEFVKSLNYVFYRIALTGVAAIIILLISLYLVEGSFSLNSFLGLGNGYDESIICLLTGN